MLSMLSFVIGTLPMNTPDDEFIYNSTVTNDSTLFEEKVNKTLESHIVIINIERVSKFTSINYDYTRSKKYAIF